MQSAALAHSRTSVRTQRLCRPPRPELRPFVQVVWAIDAPASSPCVGREHVLPTGQMHLVFRLGEGKLRLFRDASDRHGESASSALIGGARDTYYIREVSGTLRSVGVQLRPGAAEALFGASAEEFAGRHTPLDQLWGRQVSSIHDQLATVTSLDEAIDRLEAILIARVRRVRAMHPAVARALRQFRFTNNVGRIARESGYSHRTLISQFKRAVGLGPREYTRVLRLQRALREMAGSGSLADLAAAAGYSDQAHLSREFRAFSGVTPHDYRRSAPESPHHLAARRGIR